ncbi:MAG: metallophosphoesterase [Lewinella sp.]
MKRRTFLNRARQLTGLGLLAGVYTWQVEPFWLEFVERKLPIQHLPAPLVGKTLMQISDIHVGNRFDHQFIIDSFQEAAVYDPDIVVYTGDYVSYETEEQIDQLRKVMKYAVKGKLGTVGILGNHDYGKGWQEKGVDRAICSVLASAGVQVLRNEEMLLGGLNVIGLDDLWGTNFDPAAVLATHDAGRANLLLCHNPDVCDMDVWHGYRGWILAGHTHGGQCKPPFLQPPLLPVKNRNYTAGAFDLGDGRQLYINRALGHSYQVRFNVRPEVTVFELTQAG